MSAEPAGTRGDIAQALNQAAQTRLANMQAAVLDPQDATSFAPLIGYLNDYVYKGQAEAGIAAVYKAHANQPEAVHATLQTYGARLRQSQWFADLNRLNDGKLIGLLEQIDTPTPAKP